MTLVYRSTIGRRLTVSEGDGNISELSGSAGITFLPSGTGAVATTVQGELRAFVRPAQFNAIEDGAADDSTALINMFASISGGEVKFGRSKTYRITKSIFLGSFSTSGNAQSSFSWGANGTQFWGGTVQNAKSDLMVDLNGSTVLFDGATNLPVFCVIGGTRVRFRNGYINGANGSTRASEGIWFAAGVNWQNTIDNVTIRRCKRGLRFGDKKHWTEDPVTFTNYWPANVTTSDGWSIEYNTLPNYNIYDCDTAASVESAQAVHVQFGVGDLTSDNVAGYGLHLLAGRVQFQDVVFGGTPAWGVYFPPQMTTVVLQIQKGTWEGTGNNFILKDKYGTTEGAGDYVPSIDLENFTGGTVDLGGAFSLTIKDSNIYSVIADTNTNSAAAATQRISIKNSTIQTVLNWAQTGTTIWELETVRFMGDGAITTPFASQFFTSYLVNMRGCRFEGASFTADILSLNGNQNFGQLILALADSATFQIEPRGAIGLMIVSSSTPAGGAFMFGTDANNATLVAENPANNFSITKGTANRTNVYADGVNRGFWIENKNGAARNYRVTFSGSPVMTGNI